MFFCAVLLQALSDPYFLGLANVEDEPSTHPISKFEFDFERRKLTKDDARELIYREVLSQIAILISDDLFVFLLFTMILIQFLNRSWSIIPRCCGSILRAWITHTLCIQGSTYSIIAAQSYIYIYNVL